MYGDVFVALEGSSYVVRYDNAAWDELKVRFGVVSEVECARVETVDGHLALFAAGLRAHQSQITSHDVLELALGGEALRDACHRAIALSLPDLKAADPKAKPRQSKDTPTPHALRIECMKAGMTPTEFSAITPREAVMFIEGRQSLERRQFQLALITAWHTEAFARTKKLPPLKSLLDKASGGPSDREAARAERAERARSWFKRAAQVNGES
jgi:hypothetical protein